MEAIASVPDEDKYNHEGELGRAVQIQPKKEDMKAMQPRSRCFKCQGLYKWFIPDEELKFGEKVYPVLSCAEVLCNFFCLRVRPALEYEVATADKVPARAAAPVALTPAQEGQPAQTVTAPYWPPNWGHTAPWRQFQADQALTNKDWDALGSS